MFINGIDSTGTVVCIMNALYDLERENPRRRREDVVVIMTRSLYERLNLEIFGCRHLPAGAVAMIADAEIRIMEGTGEEWYITAAHGFAAQPPIFEGGKTVMIPKIETEAQS